MTRCRQFKFMRFNRNSLVNSRKEAVMPIRFYQILRVFAILMMLGTSVSCVKGCSRDKNGDGVEEHQTLIATLLGYERGLDCYHLYHEGWICRPWRVYLGKKLKNPTKVRHFDGYNTSYTLKTRARVEHWGVLQYFVAYFGVGAEILLSLVLLAFASDKIEALQKEEENS